MRLCSLKGCSAQRCAVSRMLAMSLMVLQHYSFSRLASATNVFRNLYSAFYYSRKTPIGAARPVIKPRTLCPSAPLVMELARWGLQAHRACTPGPAPQASSLLGASLQCCCLQRTPFGRLPGSYSLQRQRLASRCPSYWSRPSGGPEAFHCWLAS